MAEIPRILFVSYHFLPILSSETIVTANLTETLLEEKWADIDIVTANPDATRVSLDHSLSAFFPLSAKKIHRVPVPSLFNKWPGSQHLWGFFAALTISKLLTLYKFDFLVSRILPYYDGIPGLLLQKNLKKSQIKWLINFNDPLIDDYMIAKSALRKKIMQRYQESLFEKSDFLSFPCEEMKRHVLSHHYKNYSSKSLVFPHCYRKPISAPVPFSKQKVHNKVLIIHAGSIYSKRSADIILDSLRLLDKTILDKIKLIFVGLVSPDHNLSKTQEFPEVIQLMGRVSYGESLQWMATADILLLVDPSIEHTPFFPGKLPEYIQTGKPIIALTKNNSCSARILKHYPAFIVDPADQERLAQVISQVAEINFPNKLNIKYDPLINLSCDTVAQDFMETINNLL